MCDCVMLPATWCVCPLSFLIVAPGIISVMGVPIISSDVPQAWMHCSGPKTHWFWVPWKFAKPSVVETMLCCEHADKKTAMVHLWPLFCVLTMGLLRWTPTSFCTHSQSWPRLYSRPFKLSLYSQTESFLQTVHWSFEIQNLPTSHSWIFRHVGSLLTCKGSLCWSLCALLGHNPPPTFSPWVSDAPSLSHQTSQVVKEISRIREPFFFHSSLPRGRGPIPVPLFPCPFLLLHYLGILLADLVECDLTPAFSRFSVRCVLHVDVFLMYLWEEVSSRCLYSVIFISSHSVAFLNFILLLLLFSRFLFFFSY